MYTHLKLFSSVQIYYTLLTLHKEVNVVNGHPPSTRANLKIHLLIAIIQYTVNFYFK